MLFILSKTESAFYLIIIHHIEYFWRYTGISPSVRVSICIQNNNFNNSNFVWQLLQFCCYCIESCLIDFCYCIEVVQGADFNHFLLIVQVLSPFELRKNVNSTASIGQGNIVFAHLFVHWSEKPLTLAIIFEC